MRVRGRVLSYAKDLLLLVLALDLDFPIICIGSDSFGVKGQVQGQVS